LSSSPAIAWPASPRATALGSTSLRRSAPPRLPPSRASDLALLEDTAALSDLVLDPALEHYDESGAESGLDDDPGDGLDDL
jgi:hypothetical protein